MRISDWSSDVCSSDLLRDVPESQRGVWRAACNERRPATEHGIDMLFWGSIFIEPEQRVGGFYATSSVSEFRTVARLRLLNLERAGPDARTNTMRGGNESVRKRVSRWAHIQQKNK